MKKKVLPYFIFAFVILLVGLFFVCSPYYFGSKTDWLGQHVAFPEYFRNLFYQTHDLFPDFAFHIGSGQNIYHFAYYGLWNPIVMFSYLLPMIPMSIYLMIVSLLGIWVSVSLLYYFLKAKMSSKIAFLSCFFYLFACPIFFHAHRHLMFVNYMPFLIWGLIAIDRYFKEKKIMGLFGSVLGMILTSYYYSIGGIFVLIIYGIYVWLQKNEFHLKAFLKDGFSFLIPVIFAILVSSFLLFPITYAMLQGRGDFATSTSLLSLFLPNMKLDNILYSTYSLGLTGIFIFSICAFLVRKNIAKRYLGFVFIIICFIPIVAYLLNGTLYIRTKVLIPFLPLGIYMIGVFLEKLLLEKKLSLSFWICFGIFHVFAFFFGLKSYLYGIDLAISLIALFLFIRSHKPILFIVPIFMIACFSCIVGNLNDNYVSKKYSNKEEKKLVEEITDGITRTSIQVNTLYGINEVYQPNHYRTSLYSSIYNEEYANFFEDTFENPLPYRNRLIHPNSNSLPFQILMGEEYLIYSKGKSYIGYENISEFDNYILAHSELPFPLMYGRKKTMAKSEFSELSYPYTVEALLSLGVTESGNRTLSSHLKPISLKGVSQIGSSIQIKKQNQIYQIDVTKKDKIQYHLNQPYQNTLLFIDFKLLTEAACTDGDLSISINGITNKLTCKEWNYKNQNKQFSYILSENRIENLTIEFSKGHFDLSDFHIYALDADILKTLKDDIIPFTFNLKQTKGDIISGTIDMDDDGYLLSSIPYDKGFTILVDGKEQKCEKVNNAFLGTKLTKGNHFIVIQYHAPYASLGQKVSLLSLILFFIYSIIQKRYRK